MTTGVSETDSTVLSISDIRMLAEVGFIAASGGDARNAQTIFKGLRVLRPSHAFAYIGLALAAMSVGAIEESVRILREEGLKVNPANNEILAFLGLALSLANRPAECESVVKRVLANSGESPERALAAALLSKLRVSPAGKEARPELVTS